MQVGLWVKGVRLLTMSKSCQRTFISLHQLGIMIYDMPGAVFAITLPAYMHVYLNVPFKGQLHYE